MKHLEAAFNNRFRGGGGIELPRLSVLGRTAGILNNGCWHVLFLFGKNKKEDYLDYSAYSRFYGHEHSRIHQDGQFEDLPTYLEFCPNGKEEKFRTHNANVRELLLEKGLNETRIMYGVRIIDLKECKLDGLVDFDETQIVMTDAVVLFWKSPAVFSQWTRAYFEVNGQLFTSAEQYLMAQKARLFGDEGTQGRIMASSDPAEQQRLGRQIVGFDQRIWEREKYRIVVEGNLAKFSQDATRRDALLSTGDRVLAEASPSDRRWGIGYSALQIEAYDCRIWGRNFLGQTLMDVRSRLR